MSHDFTTHIPLFRKDNPHCEHNPFVPGTSVLVHVFGDGTVNIVCTMCRRQAHTEFTPESTYTRSSNESRQSPTQSRTDASRSIAPRQEPMSGDIRGHNAGTRSR